MRLFVPPAVLLATLLPSPLRTQDVPDSAMRARVEWFIHDAPSHWFGSTRSDIVARIGQPRRVSASPNEHPNPYDTLTTDTLVTLQYDSASFAYYVVPNIHAEYLVEVIVSTSRYVKQSPISIGATIAHVRDYFGDSAIGPTPSATYSCYWCESLSAQSTVTFWFDDHGRVRGIKWQWQVD